MEGYGIIGMTEKYRVLYFTVKTSLSFPYTDLYKKLFYVWENLYCVIQVSSNFKMTKIMFETICDINRLNFYDPIFYTEKYQKNEYVKANDLSKHIHLFNHEISRIDYSMFSNLKGHISKLEETQKQRIYDGAIRTNLYETKDIIYHFKSNLELYQIIKNSYSSQEEILLFDSLKNPKNQRITQSFDNIKSSQTDITYNEFLEYQVIEESKFYDRKMSKWENQNQRNPKYIFKENEGLIYKIYNRNNRDEQSKTNIIYNWNFQILESKTYSQKKKTELLYEAIFHYEQGLLKKVIYIRHKPTKYYNGDYKEEINFEYDEKGLLVNLIRNSFAITWAYDQNENPIKVKTSNIDGRYSIETYNNYRYDNFNNWIYKESEDFIDGAKINHKQISRKIEYFSAMLSI
ncbi:MAG: hypothetical protein MUC49_11215 [Raineya sp.]|jgi:hypothetical protein|nr:hypothetical protein [Raineya sp.]